MTETQLSALDMAKNLAASVQRMAREQELDPLSSAINRGGVKAVESSRMAANLALVSIAEDLHQLVKILSVKP